VPICALSPQNEPFNRSRIMVQRVFRSGITRVKRRLADLNQAEAERGRADLDRILRQFPELANYEERAEEAITAFRVFHLDYNGRIGHSVHAASPELVALLSVLFESCKPSRAVDLGSGFSSFVLRTLASRVEEDVEIWSVDDSAEWRQKTQDYLEELDHQTQNLLTWDDFIANNPGDFDLVLHDMGSMEFREQTLRQALDLAKPGGLVILDDVHKPAYRKAAMAVLEELGLEWFSLREWTRDPLTRYAWLVIR
jgi:predicted O-methyltransferase YrrM